MPIAITTESCLTQFEFSTWCPRNSVRAMGLLDRSICFALANCIHVSVTLPRPGEILLRAFLNWGGRRSCCAHREFAPC